jgi:hypothetical protein
LNQSASPSPGSSEIGVRVVLAVAGISASLC